MLLQCRNIMQDWFYQSYWNICSFFLGQLRIKRSAIQLSRNSDSSRLINLQSHPLKFPCSKNVTLERSLLSVRKVSSRRRKRRRTEGGRLWSQKSSFLFPCPGSFFLVAIFWRSFVRARYPIGRGLRQRPTRARAVVPRVMEKLSVKYTDWKRKNIYIYRPVNIEKQENKKHIRARVISVERVGSTREHDVHTCNSTYISVEREGEKILGAHTHTNKHTQTHWIHKISNRSDLTVWLSYSLTENWSRIIWLLYRNLY